MADEQIKDKSIKLKLEVLTPTTIGTGAEWKMGYDFILGDDGILYHININKMNKFGVPIQTMTQLMLNGADKNAFIREIGGKNNLKKVSDYQIPWLSKTEEFTAVKPCLRNQLHNYPIIAGSSLKGAITSILYALWKDKNKDNQSTDDVFGRAVDGTDFRRFIQVSDFHFEENTSEMINTKVFNLSKRNDSGDWIGGWKHRLGGNSTNSEFKQKGFNTIYECYGLSKEADGFITLKKEFFEFVKPILNLDKSNKMANKLSWVELCNIINDWVFNHLAKDLDFFEKYSQAQHNDDILERYNYLYDYINDLNTDECVIRLAAGSGFHSVTGDWRFDDYTEYDADGNLVARMGQGTQDNLPKSRKIAIRNNQFFPMGFVKLSLAE